jgi:hypothetical protein
MAASVSAQCDVGTLDRVFVPASSFNSLGRDLAGQHWHDLERALGVPTTLLKNTTPFAF